MKPRLLFVGTSLVAGGGGIARVGRMAHLAVAPAVAAGRLDARSLVLHDREPVADLGVCVSVHRSRRVPFALAVRRASLSATHVHADHGGPARATWRRGPWARPLAVWMHGLDAWGGARHEWVERFRRSALLLAPSRLTCERAEAIHGGLAHARVCPLATEQDEPPPARAPRRREAPATAAIVGRLARGEDKGHRALLASWREVEARVPGARLLIVGDGDARGEFEAIAHASGGRIEFRGFVGDEGMEAVWRESDLLVMPSRGEGFGLVYVEAMRQALPCIASVHDAGAEVNVHGETGWNVDLDRPGDLVARLVDLLADGERARDMGRAGFACWLERYRFRHFRARYLALLEPFMGLRAGALA